MRILYIVTAFPRHPGDVITPWMIELIDRLRSRSVEVEVLAPSYHGLGDHLHDGIPVHRFRYAPVAWEQLTHDQTTPDRLRERPWYAGLLPGYLLAGTWAAAKLARSGRFDLVHAFWPLPHGLFGLAARRSGGIPLVSTFFGVELTWLRHQLPFLAPLVRGVIRHSDAVTVISRHTAAEVERLVPGARVRRIPFGAAIESSEIGWEDGDRLATPVSAPSPAPSREDDPYRLLFVGRLVERKGVSILLEAIARLRRAGAELSLAVVGDGPERPKLLAQRDALGLGEQVRFTGFVPAPELLDLYASSDLFVLPAVRDSKGDVEGLGVVLIEALLRGLPVVASDSGGISDVVRDGQEGLLVPSGDVAALAAAIDRLRTDPALARSLARRGRASVRERFSWDRITHDLIALYGEVIAAHSGGSGREGSAAGEPG